MNQSSATFVLAREARGYTQKRLAEELGVAQGTVSKIENGLLEPPADVLDRYVKVLGYPRAFFARQLEYRDLPPTFWRKRKRLTEGRAKAIQARVNVMRLNVHTLVRSADVPENGVPITDLGSYGGSATDVARDLRAKWGVPRGPVKNVTRLLEDHGVLVVRCDFGTDDVQGLSLYEPRDGIPPLVIVSSTVPGDRLRWTLAHELGHLVLHNHPRFLPGESCEEEADEFASEFLMPAADIKHDLRGNITLETIAQLKLAWRVSMQALIMRAHSLGRIQDRYKQVLFMRMSQMGFRTKEPNPVEREEPTLITELINFHIKELGYSDDQLADALCLMVSEFRETYGLDSPRGLRLVRL